MMNEEEEPPLDDDDEGPFPFPPPPLPPPVRARMRADRDMVFVARRTGSGDRDHEDIMLRRVPRSVGHRFRGAAGARGLTHAQYLAALVDLHEAMRQRADQGDPEVGATLERLGLRTVSI
jgi:hypothetical protein